MTKSINNPLRRLIYYHFKVLKRPSFEIHNDLLNVPNQGFSCTLRYLEDLLLKLEHEEFAMHWILGPFTSTGRPRLISGDDVQFILQTIHSNKRIYLHQLSETYRNILGRPIQPSFSTLHRNLHRNHISVKNIERRNINRDEVECEEYLERVCNVHPDDIFDMDGTAFSQESFLTPKGRSTVGEPCILPQFYIGQ